MVVKGDWNGPPFEGTDFGAVALLENGSNSGIPNSTVGPSIAPTPGDFESSPSPPNPEDFERSASTSSVVSQTQPTTFPSSDSSLIFNTSSANPVTPSPMATASPSDMNSSSSSSRTQPVVLTSVAAAAGASMVGGLGLYLWWRSRRTRQRQQSPMATSNQTHVNQNTVLDGSTMSTSTPTTRGQDRGSQKPPSYRSLHDPPLHHQHEHPST